MRCVRCVETPHKNLLHTRIKICCVLIYWYCKGLVFFMYFNVVPSTTPDTMELFWRNCVYFASLSVVCSFSHMLLAAARYPVCMWKFNACSIFQQQKKSERKQARRRVVDDVFFGSVWKLRFIVHALKNMECLIIYSLTLEILWSAESGKSIRRGPCWDDHQATSSQPLELSTAQQKKTAK